MCINRGARVWKVMVMTRRRLLHVDHLSPLPRAHISGTHSKLKLVTQVFYVCTMGRHLGNPLKEDC